MAEATESATSSMVRRPSMTIEASFVTRSPDMKAVTLNCREGKNDFQIKLVIIDW